MPEKKEISANTLEQKIASMSKTVEELTKANDELTKQNQNLALAYNEAKIIKDALVTQIRLMQQK